MYGDTSHMPGEGKRFLLNLHLSRMCVCQRSGCIGNWTPSQNCFLEQHGTAEMTSSPSFDLMFLSLRKEEDY